MINKNQFNPEQSNVLQILKDRIKTREKTTLIQMPSRTGKGSIITEFLKDYFSNNFNSGFVIIIVSNPISKKQLNIRLSENLQDFDQKAILIITEKELKNPKQIEIIIKLDIRMIIMLDTINSNLLNSILSPNSTQLIAFTNESDFDELFGSPNYIYSINKAIEYGQFVPIKYAFINLEINNSLFTVQNSILEAENKIEGSNLDFIYSSESYMRVLSKDILSRIKQEKTLIISPNINHAENLSIIINELSNAQISSTVHSQKQFSIYKDVLSRFESDASSLQILIIVELNHIFSDITCIKNIVPLKQFKNLKRLRKLLELAQIKTIEKEYIVFLDYIGNLKSLNSLLESDFEILDISVPKLFLRESEIRIRDKRNVDTVLGADELAEELSDIDLLPILGAL